MLCLSFIINFVYDDIKSRKNKIKQKKTKQKMTETL